MNECDTGRCLVDPVCKAARQQGTCARQQGSLCKEVIVFYRRLIVGGFGSSRVRRKENDCQTVVLETGKGTCGKKVKLLSCPRHFVPAKDPKLRLASGKWQVGRLKAQVATGKVQGELQRRAARSELPKTSAEAGWPDA